MPNEISILLASILVKGLFGVPMGFVLGFFAKLFLLFAASAGVSKILRLERAYEHSDANSDKKDG